MKYPLRFGDTIHLLAAIQITREIAERSGQDLGKLLSSASIAQRLHTNPAYVRKIMGLAARGGLLTSERGRANPILTRPAAEITLLDIHGAVEGSQGLLNLHMRTYLPCNTGRQIQFAIGAAYGEVQAAAEAAMAKITLQSIIDSYYAHVGDDTLPA